MISASDEYQKITYSNDQEKVARTFLRYTTIDHIVVAPNTFDRNGAIIPFKYWTRGSTEDYPGDVISCAGTDELKLYPYWGSQNDSVSVTYNLYNNGSKYEYKTMTYTYKNILEKLPSDSDTGFSREGYKLIGWSYTENGNVNFSLETPVTMVNNLRLYAVWVQINQLIVIVDNLLLSADDLPSTYKTTYTVIGTLSEGDSVELTVTYDSSTDHPTAVGVYTMKIDYKVVNTSGKDVTGNYKITVSDSFLTIYSGDHSLVID